MVSSSSTDLSAGAGPKNSRPRADSDYYPPRKATLPSRPATTGLEGFFVAQTGLPMPRDRRGDTTYAEQPWTGPAAAETALLGSGAARRPSTLEQSELSARTSTASPSGAGARG